MNTCKNGHANPSRTKRGACKVCEAKYKEEYYFRARENDKERQKRNRRKAITHLGGKCIDCGVSDCRVLVFDHLRNKLCTVACLLGRSWKRIAEELEKCELVCENCHLTRTSSRLPKLESNRKKRCKERRTQARRRAIHYLGGICTDCRSNNHQTLVFDHLRNKTVNVAAILGCRWERIEEELKKCELVCANCHRIRTRTRFPKRDPKPFVGKRELLRKATTHCANGHPYTEDNVYITKNGWRQCKICRRASKCRYNRRKARQFNGDSHS